MKFQRFQELFMIFLANHQLLLSGSDIKIHISINTKVLDQLDFEIFHQNLFLKASQERKNTDLIHYFEAKCLYGFQRTQLLSEKIA